MEFYFIYSFIGWCIEVALKYRQYHRFINRGFLTGPWLPIYGSGAVLITVVVGNGLPDENDTINYVNSQPDSFYEGLFDEDDGSFEED